MRSTRAALLAGRLTVYLTGLVVLCAGIVLNTKTGLGVAPINSVPYLGSEITPLTLGQATSLLYLLCIAAQAVMLRRFSLTLLLQLPFSYLFGLLVDLFDRWLDVVRPSGLPEALFWLLVANLLTALGVTLAVSMQLVAAPPDSTVQALSQVYRLDFGLAKNGFDLTMLALSALGGLLFAHRLVGIGAGTVVTALLVGRLAGLFRRKLDRPIRRLASVPLFSPRTAEDP